MPNCFQLTKKGETQPMPLAKIDEMICEVLGQEVHPKFYAVGWFDAIGFGIAIGKPLGSEELREMVRSFESEKLMLVLTFLEENFTSDAWAQRGWP